MACSSSLHVGNDCYCHKLQASSALLMECTWGLLYALPSSSYFMNSVSCVAILLGALIGIAVVFGGISLILSIILVSIGVYYYYHKKLMKKKSVSPTNEKCSQVYKIDTFS